MTETQKNARAALLVPTGVLTIGSVLVALGNTRGHWMAAAIMLWVAVLLLLVNLSLGEVIVRRGRS